MGPFTRWPTGEGVGFDYFYGFLAGETSQWEPRLVENFNSIEPPHDPKYHLSEDLADKAIAWMKRHRAFAPDKPFLMYWAPGAAHGPHHIFKEWADKYKGKFDDGWDALRERVFKRQKELGWIPPDAKLTPRAESMAGWDSIPEAERPFQRRLMEVFAGFTEHVDAQVGKLIDGLDEMGMRDNTIVFYIFGDNGSSAEGQKGSISELLAQNNIPNTIEQQLGALDKIGGLDALGGPKMDNMYHAGWAWAGDTPFQYTKLIASHFGGTRNPMAVSWPARDQARQDAAAAVPPCQRHRADDLRDSRHQAAESGRRIQAGSRSTASAWPTLSPTPRRPRISTRNISTTTAAAASITTAGSPAPSGRSMPWDTAGSAARLNGWDRARTSGSCTTSRRISRRPKISRARSPNVSPK